MAVFAGNRQAVTSCDDRGGHRGLDTAMASGAGRVQADPVLSCVNNMAG